MRDGSRANAKDATIVQLTDNAVRRLGRRRALFMGMKYAAAAVAGVAIANLPARRAYADTVCHPPHGTWCSAYGYSCPSGGGCPSQCLVCKSSDGCGVCPWSSGYWFTDTGTCGICGQGFKLCYDCRCTGCSSTCGCMSGCLCSGCCSPAEVKQEIARVRAEAAARA